MRCIILLGFTLGLSGCSYTAPVVVNDGKNVLIGTTTASASGGNFKVSDNEVSCSGTYDAWDTSRTIQAQTDCSDGRTGTALITRDSTLSSGNGIIKMSDGKTATFLFGQPAIQFIEAIDDEAQCKSYGFKKGSKDFSNCMMKMLQARQIQTQTAISEAAQRQQYYQEQNQKLSASKFFVGESIKQ